MSFNKNSANNLSMLDSGQVLQDAHNSDEHALDVVISNSLVPARYSRTTCELKDMGDGTFETEYINYYGFGIQESNQIEMANNPTGAKEKTNLNFSGLTTAIAGSYFTVYDELGSVGVWYNLDAGTPNPGTGAARDIEVSIVTGNVSTDIATATASALNLDSKFSAAAVSNDVLMESSTIGLKTDASAGTSGITITISKQGDVDLQSKYFLLYDAANVKYHVWFNINSLGVDPAPAASTAIEIPLAASETSLTAAAKMQIILEAHADFTSTLSDDFVTVTNAVDGDSTGMVDGDSGMYIDQILNGADQDLVCRIRVLFDGSNFITGMEKVV